MNKVFKMMILPVLALSLFSCGDNSGTDTAADYTDYMEYQVYPDEMYSQTATKYAIVITNPNCPHCEDIKSYYFNYIDAINQNDSRCKYDAFYWMYIGFRGTSTRTKMINISSSDEGCDVATIKQKMIDEKVNKIENTYCYGTPSLYVIENGYFSDIVVGSSDVAKALALV